MTSQPARSGYNVHRTLRTLEVLASGPTSAQALAAELGVNVRTSRRILFRLVHDGYAARAPGKRGRFEPAPRLRQLALELQAQDRHSFDLGEGDAAKRRMD